MRCSVTYRPETLFLADQKEMTNISYAARECVSSRDNNTIDFFSLNTHTIMYTYILYRECSFVTKAINAERAGAVLAIITEINSANDSDYYIEMIHDNSSYDTNIPALYLLGKDGRMILRTLQKLNRHYAVINMPVNLTFTPAHLINQPRW